MLRHPALGFIGLAAFDPVRGEADGGDPGAEEVRAERDDDFRAIKAHVWKHPAPMGLGMGIQHGGHRESAVADVLGPLVLGEELGNGVPRGRAMLSSRQEDSI